MKFNILMVSHQDQKAMVGQVREYTASVVAVGG